MAITHTPLCTVDWCAYPSDPDWHVCIVCQSPAVQHAHVESRSHNPSRRKDKANQVMLCVLHHQEVDLRQNGTHGHAIRQIPGRGRLYFRFDLHGNTTFQKVISCDDAERPTTIDASGQQGSASSQAGEGPPGAVSTPDVGDDPLNGRQSPGQRPALVVRKRQPSPAPAGPGLTNDTAVGAQPGLALMDAGDNTEGAPPQAAYTVSPAFSLESDWAALDDDTLQRLYEEGEHRQQEGYLLKCKAVWTYRERHVQTWGESWTGQAIEHFGCSRRYAYAYANLWQIYVTSDTYLREGMAQLTDSRSLMQIIGRTTVEEGARLLESAVAHVAEYAQPPSVKALMGAEQPERERHQCPTCGYSHYAVVEAEWKA